jgi:preprotein translocase subunit SecA
LDDELWRLFGTRGQFLLGGWDEDEPVEAKIITKSIERAQKKVELNHFESRKHVLQYDDVMNVQREVIYRERRRALQGDDIRDTVVDMVHKATLAEAEKHCPRDVRPEEWDARKLYLGLGRLFGLANVQKHIKEDDLHDLRWHERTGSLTGGEWDVILSDGTSFAELVEKLYEEREDQLGTDSIRSIERWQVMRSIDEHWMEHLAEMDYLRDAIWQQGYAQKEPIGVYRQEGFELFQKMLGEIRREVTEAIFAFQATGFEEAPVGMEFGELTEARLLDVLPMDDGIDDGAMLLKDDEGEDDTVLVAHQPSGLPRNAGTTANPQGHAGPANRAERRANKKRRH